MSHTITITHNHLSTAMFSRSSWIFIIQKWHQNGWDGWSWPLLGLLQVHGILPSTGHPGQGFPLLPEHGHQLLLLLGHQEQGVGTSTCAEKERKPLNTEEKCQAQNGIPQQKEASPFFHYGLLSGKGCWLLILLWTLWLHKLFRKGTEATPKDEAWKTKSGDPDTILFSTHPGKSEAAFKLQCGCSCVSISNQRGPRWGSCSG